MKKRNLLFLVAGVLLLTGCNKTTECTITIDQTNYKVESNYTITYDGKGNVAKVDTVEIVYSDDEDILDQFENTVKSSLGIYDQIKHYDYDIKREDGKLIETIKINYKKMDVDKFISINNASASMFENGKLKYDTMITAYKSLGATCKEK